MIRYLLLLLSTITLSACINNDIPLPYVKGDVFKFAVKGQKESRIDNVKRLITVVLSDSVDILNSEISQMDITADAKCKLAKGAFIDLSSPYPFDIVTYQTYSWRIETTQPINRHIVVDNQIGLAQIDVLNCNAIVRVPVGCDVRTINVKEFQLGLSTATTTPSPLGIQDYTLPHTYDVDNFGRKQRWIVHVLPTLDVVTTGAVMPFAKFAFLNGTILEGSTDLASFDIRKSSQTEWNSVKATVKGNKISARVQLLDPSTSYIFRARLGEDFGSEVTFNTESAPSVENLNFDTWTLGGKKWFPNSTAVNTFWATGNEGVVTAGKDSNSVPVSGAGEAVKGQAAKLTTQGGVMLAKIAAGNIFTGIYKSGLPTEFDKMRKLAVFGRPYTGRPTKLKGWFRYFPQTVDIAADPKRPFPDSIGKKDWCQIKVTLENWGSATERPENEASIKHIAYGEFRTNKEFSSYTPFEFDVVYSDLITLPTHISIVATSSINGGDFCGGSGSVLYVDEFELGWD
ncbi:MAG: PCMD domain-containing protein [Mucinivorans sp.]